MENTTTETTNELSDEQIDALVDKMDPPREAESLNETEKEAPPQEEGAGQEQAAAAQKAAEEFYEFQHSGKNIKATREQLINWAKMGIDYPQKAQSLNQKYSQQVAQWNQEREQWEKKWGSYRQVDEWATKNPDQWKALEQSWQQRAQTHQGTQPNDPYASKIQDLEKKLNSTETFIQQQQERQKAEKAQQEDQILSQEIQGIRDQFKDLPWDNADEEGKSLEVKILEHAQKNGIQNFKTAFRDYCHDMLIERERAQAKQSVAKGIQNKTKMGILSESSSPKRSLSAPKNIREQSYEDLMRDGLEEIRSQERRA